MGNYESMTVGASVELEVEDNSSDYTLDLIDATIADALGADLKQARKLASDQSYVHDYKLGE